MGQINKNKPKYGMKGERELKIVHFQIEDELHKKMKMQVITKDKSIKQYIIELIEKDLQKEKEQTR